MEGRPLIYRAPFHSDSSHVSEVMLTAGAPLLAHLPIDPQVTAMCDAGKIEAVSLAETPALMKAFIQAMPATRR